MPQPKPKKRRKFLQVRYIVGIATLLLSLFLAIIQVLFFWTPTTKHPPQIVRKPKPTFPLLDSSKYSKTQQRNVLVKPFQWYRDHWSNANTTSSRHKPWKDSDLPQWTKDYFEWHRQQILDSISSKKKEPTKYLIVQCLEQDRQCGGLADRMLPLPFYVLLAAQTKRVLILVWTVPFPLEEFFMPNGLDWRLPPSLYEDTNGATLPSILSTPSTKDRTVFSGVPKLVKAVHSSQNTVVRARIQDRESAWEYYDAYHRNNHHHSHPTKGEGALASFAMQHYRELFSVLFQPTPPLQEALKQRKNFTQQHPCAQPYVVAHYRALYNAEPLPRGYIHAAAKNAVNCASQLLPRHCIFMLSDSIEALTSLQDYRPDMVIPVFGSTSNPNRNALHLDKATRNNMDHSYKPSDFYDIFLDVFLMAEAQCVVYGQGGFGKLGSLLSRNMTCAKRHFDQGKMVSCAWKG